MHELTHIGLARVVSRSAPEIRNEQNFNYYYAALSLCLPVGCRGFAPPPPPPPRCVPHPPPPLVRTPK